MIFLSLFVVGYRKRLRALASYKRTIYSENGFRRGKTVPCPALATVPSNEHTVDVSADVRGRRTFAHRIIIIVIIYVGIHKEEKKIK